MSDAVSVSIVMACYNGERFLAETLRSAIAQTKPPLEILVVDDGSTDGSAAIGESFGAPVRVIRQVNQGEAVARNRGIAEAKGTHILFLDADDLLAPESLERLAAAVGSSPDAVSVMGCAWFTTDPGAPYFTKDALASSFFPHIIEENLAPIHCWLVPTRLIRDAEGFVETLHWFEDWDLWWRIGMRASSLTSVAYAGALYRQHRQSQLATTKKQDRARGHADVIVRLADALMARPDLLDRYAERLFWSLWSALNHCREAGLEWSAVDDVVQRLAALSRSGPESLRRSRSARTFRWLGVKNGYTLQRLKPRRSPATDAASEPQHRRA
ncbi:MAG TPA: glycosyltransferase family A protein [Vicinamibacterales bacterium]|nr:glycosyltransferase family A protein [Vicinamibacterales bacterium]